MTKRIVLLALLSNILPFGKAWLGSINAQEADRYVGYQHVKFQTACHPKDVKTYDTKTLRERFVMEKVMEADSILLTYSHYDRFIFGGAMPVEKTLKLENFWELGLDVDKTIPEKYFMYNRELGVVNCGLGDGVVIVDGKEYPLQPKEALYIGRGHIGKDKKGNSIDENKSVEFRSKDPKNPAKFYLNSATAHQHYKTQWITLDGRKGSLKAAVWGPVGSVEEANSRTVYKLIVNDVLEEGPCQLQLGLTQLNPGAVWNTMPPHTHGRRIEAYYYFNLPEGADHLTRHGRATGEPCRMAPQRTGNHESRVVNARSSRHLLLHLHLGYGRREPLL